MTHQHTGLKIMIAATCFAIVFALAALYAVMAEIENRRNQVLGDEVNIYASVGACLVDFRVRPDERTFANWGTYIEVDVNSPSGSYLGSFYGTTNPSGELAVNFCTAGIPAYSPGVYTFDVKGISHLTESIPYFFPAVGTQTIDLSTTSQRLTPGDINGTGLSQRDDEVNSLDMAQIIAGYDQSYGDAGYDAVDDLNYDQIIDYTDLQIMLKNTYLSPNHDDALYDYPPLCI